MPRYVDPWALHPMLSAELPHVVEMKDEGSARIWWAIAHVRDLAGRKDVEKQVLRAATVAWIKNQREIACSIVASHYKLDADRLINRTEQQYAFTPRRGEEVTWEPGESMELEGLYDDLSEDEQDYDPDGDDPDEISAGDDDDKDWF